MRQVLTAQDTEAALIWTAWQHVCLADLAGTSLLINAQIVHITAGCLQLNHHMHSRDTCNFTILC